MRAEMPFPHVPDEETFFEYFAKQDELWRPAVEELLEAERVAHTPSALARLSGGSNILYALDDERILKIFPPITIEEFETECALLESLNRTDLGQPVPPLYERGVYDGWGWCVIGRLDGMLGRKVWDDIPFKDRERLVAEAGEWMAATWASEVFQATELPEVRASWSAAQKKFRGELHQKHQRRKTTPEHLAEIEALMSDWQPRDEAVIIHADLHLGNMLFLEQAGRWEISGILDFADGLAAPRIYDLSTPLLSLTRGHPKLTEILYHHTFGPNHGIDAKLMTQWILLHRFFHIPYTLERDWVPDDCATIEQLGRGMSGLS